MKEQYGATPYNRNAIQGIDSNHIQFQIDDQSFFEQLLLCIRGHTIAYRSSKKKQTQAKTKAIEDEIEELEKRAANDDSTEISERLKTLRNELEELRKEYINDLFVRTRKKWVEFEKKPTKYFHSLEKGTT